MMNQFFRTSNIKDLPDTSTYLVRWLPAMEQGCLKDEMKVSKSKQWACKNL